MNVYTSEEAMHCEAVLIIPVYEGQELPQEIRELTGEISLDGLCLESGNEYRLAGTKVPVTIIGMGKAEKITRKMIREMGGKVARRAKKKSSVYAAGLACEKITVQEAAKELAFGIVTGQYDFVKLHAQKEEKPEISLFGEGMAEAAELVQEAAQTAACINYSRNLGNTPSNYMTPEILAEEAEKLAQELGAECEILTNSELKEMGAGALLGVNKGSAHEARMITLTYRGNGDAPFTALVGKGLTFDAGGYNVKTAGGMKGMKFDMCGGANVLGAFASIVHSKEKVNVMAVVPATENKIGPDGYTCDDVLVSLSGKTIEVTNTDAEGRLILCDALTYAQKKGAKRLIDMATLTGACVRALGTNYTGVFTNSQEFLAEFQKAAERADERIWQLPIDEDFHKQIKESSVADVVNAVPGAMAGSSLAAAFLEEFVEEGVEWIHLDIAGTGDLADKKPYTAGGATGVMIRSINELLAQ